MQTLLPSAHAVRFDASSGSTSPSGTQCAGPSSQQVSRPRAFGIVAGLRIGDARIENVTAAVAIAVAARSGAARSAADQRHARDSNENESAHCTPSSDGRKHVGARGEAAVLTQGA